ncbi:MAG: FAD-dependent oxidoreductase [Chitinispirillaceae bacterium]|nr:FAD-dependent oxidoreductase [Chitinispirillaceae bacterium]
MKKTDILIVGGGPAGITAAITARRYYPDVEITILRMEEKVLIPCGIPYIFGTVGEPEKNIIPDTVLTQNQIRLILDKAVSIDRKAQSVTTAGGEILEYRKLVLATGSFPMVPSLPGVDLENVFTVQKDVAYLRNFLNATRQAKDIVVIGGGFIGLEFADECKKNGNVNVTVIEMLPHCLLLACDDEICMRVEKKLAERGITIMVGENAKALRGNKKVEYVELKSGREIKADLVILGIGVVPNIELAEKAGLNVDKKWGIGVDDFMKTSDECIFSVGDCAQKKCLLSGGPSTIRLASIATTEARIAGANLFALRRRMECAIGIFSTCFGELAVGSAGLTERNARQLGIEIVTTNSAAPDKHPGSIPGTKELGIKMIFEKDTGLLIGGQAYGGQTVGELINFIGSMIQHKMRADEICTFQIGTHPMLTASPIAYQIVNAAQMAVMKIRKGEPAKA